MYEGKVAGEMRSDEKKNQPTNQPTYMHKWKRIDNEIVGIRLEKWGATMFESCYFIKIEAKTYVQKMKSEKNERIKAMYKQNNKTITLSSFSAET